jgi:cobalt-zinc-cadmium efflux system protein
MSRDERRWQAIRFGIALCIAILVASTELWFGLHHHSFALIADGLHVGADLITLWFSFRITLSLLRRIFKKKEHGPRYEQKLNRRGALLNAKLLGVIAGATLLGGCTRFFITEDMHGAGTFTWALVGLVGNIIQHWLVAGSGHQHPEDALSQAFRKSVLLHIASDAYTSIAVIISGGIAGFTRWHWVDPVFTIGIGLYITHTTHKLFLEIRAGHGHHTHHH